MPDITNVAIVGAGLVGQGWALVFARAGRQVRIHDAGEAETIRSALTATADLLAQAGLGPPADEIMARITIAPSLHDAVRSADYVQESVFERIDVKRDISRAIADALPDHAFVGSSTSGFPASQFTAECPRRDRFLVVHPVNPPHLVPLVEIVPAPWTDPAVARASRDLMTAVGQSPVSLSREIPGFVLNRLQGALLDEAFALLGDGYASADDIDRAVRDGLGLRWAFMGPFETIDLNAPQGLADYARRLGPMYAGFADQRHAERGWSAEAVKAADRQRREALPLADLAQRRAWRDAMLTRIVAGKAGRE
ncbi:3-hydroxyacyl-CoA dehydrogenase [Falsirhodobacter halotolerans]|uniref:3-hydroxyacyl-CoA dehydrogenase n=1 Tax=Falsirhodobacter halotolerans TaxID=1146892 RepID=UPI001FD0EC0B|nr:3-hydroxyacyl-CoA dehydrogenase [Falsirhodobacter halotolerans]MCJ8140962.1 3-hydroxyacyl-CoA dehydrogenase [Falsirhodobacter halotolerans]